MEHYEAYFKERLISVVHNLESERDRLIEANKNLSRAHGTYALQAEINRLSNLLEMANLTVKKDSEEIDMLKAELEGIKVCHTCDVEDKITLQKNRNLWKSKAESFEKAALTYREGLVKAQDVLKASHREDSSLQAKAEKLAETLRKIAAYEEHRDGICPFGCDTPNIAEAALAEFEEWK